MYSNIKFYSKDYVQHKIHIPVWFGGLKEINALGENSNIFDFNEIKIILLMFTGSQDLCLGVYTDMILDNREKC